MLIGFLVSGEEAGQSEQISNDQRENNGRRPARPSIRCGH
jgi:hypothetical protein